MRRSTTTVLEVLAALLLACASDEGASAIPADSGGVDGASAEAGAAGDGDEMDQTELAFTAPDPPVFLPCPQGWSEVPPAGEDDVATCQPWPGGEAQECDEEDEVHFPGEQGCSRIGTACDASGWPTDLPADQSVLYVRAGAEEGGDGSQAMPFGSIAEALNAAAPGAIVALASGTYAEAVELGDDQTLWGACAAQTILALTRPSRGGEATVTVSGESAVLRNLRVTGPRVGVRVAAGATLHLEGVLITEALSIGLHVAEGGQATGLSVVVAGTDFPVDRPVAFGLLVDTGAEAELRRAVFADNAVFSVLAQGAGARVQLADSLVFGTQGVTLGDLGEQLSIGVAAFDGAEVTVTGSVLEPGAVDCLSVSEEVSNGAAAANGVGAVLTVRDSLVRGAAPADPCADGIGLLVTDAGTVAVERVVLARNRAVAVFAEDGELRMSDVVLRDVYAALNQEYGSGLVLGGRFSGSIHAELERVIFRDNVAGAIIAFGEHARLDSSHVIVQRTLERACAQDTCPGDGLGTGLAALDGASLNMDHFIISGSALCGVQLADGGGIDLSAGMVVGNHIGACVRSEDFDISRLQDRVLYLENDRNLDSTELPTPSVDDLPEL